MSITSKPVPALFLEQLALGELPEPAATEVRQRIASDPDTRQRFEGTEEANAAILERFPPGAMAEQIRRRAVETRSPGRSPPRARGFVVALTAAAAVAAAVAVVPRLGRPAPDGPADRIKGLDARLVIHRKTPVGTETLSDGSVVHAGDVLQVSYVAGGHRFGAIVSVDGNGQVTLHYPKEVRSEPTLRPSGEVPLPYAYQLDNAPRFERFYFVTADQPFSVDKVLQACHRIGPDNRLPLAVSFEQVAITLSRVQP